MSKYAKVSTDLNFVEREKEVEQFWKEKDIFFPLHKVQVRGDFRIL